MVVSCGICRGQRELICSSCMNVNLLPTKIRYIEALQIVDTSRRQVNGILASVDQKEQLISHFVRGELPNLEGDEQRSVVLGSRLLKVDAVVLKSQLGRIRRSIEAARARASEAKAEIDLLKEDRTKRQLQLELRRTKICEKSNVEKTIEAVKLENERLGKQVDISKALLYQELVSLYVIRRRRIQGGVQIYTIAFSPLMSVQALLEVGPEVVDTSIEKTIKFVRQTARVQLLSLPYELPVSYSYVSKSVLEVDGDDLERFSLLFCQLIYNTIFLLRELRIVDENQEFTQAQLFRLDELVYRLAVPGGSLKDDHENVNGKTPSLKELQSRVIRYIKSRTRARRDEWHVVSS